ncbi:MAG: beta-lactamase [Candidatus Saganbacteria bacterium]|uniref:Beta-lactamase n=1 Tax=Candidatus Saganbacteria bacterium TaxID=2575572 RepID=A0A833L264_UNCSA|nr:MAG: beta-lactamase [Candidatus Saganbacteria bacterium]
MTRILFAAFIVLLNYNSFALNPVQLEKKLEQLVDKEKAGMVFIDLKSGCELSIGGSREFPAASVAKLPVMAAAYHLSQNGIINLNNKIQFREADRMEGSGVLRWMKAGRSYTIFNLIRLMIVLSDNSATKMLVDCIGAPVVNGYLAEAGITKTRITDHTMLVEPPSAEVNMTTPYEMAVLVRKIFKQDGFNKESARQMLSFMKSQKYRWGIWRGVPPGVIVADKTGNLEKILNDVGIVYTKNGCYILSIFTHGYAKQRDARIMINEISKVVYEEYTGEKVIQKKKKIIRKYKKKLSRKRRYNRIRHLRSAKFTH